MNEYSEMSTKKNINNIKIGQNVKINDYVNLYGCCINDNTTVGPFVEIQKGVTIGKSCKIQSHSFLCEGVTIEDNVFVGHNVTFTNDLFPKAADEQGRLLSSSDWNLVETKVKRGASIGSGSTILCGIEIGENALIGAGAVVVHDVPKNAIVVGNPAKVVRYTE